MVVEYPQKKAIKIVLWTNVSKIEGTTFSLQGATCSKNNRLSDLMNFKGHLFLPVSDAKIYSAATDQLIAETNFVTVNKRHIIMIAEAKE
ncbi:MAG TPA: hypothetical protein VI387_01750 [Candidatus Brocadiales bacterium]|nr:hypothetical protein [Candidatus Brocadiales bacterium]